MAVPFRTADLSDDLGERGFRWAGPDRLIYEGWFDTARISPIARPGAAPADRRDLVIRLDFYVGERDLLGVGFSDNVIFRQQYYLRSVAGGPENLSTSLANLRLFLYADERFVDEEDGEPMPIEDGRWTFSIGGTGFAAKLGIQLERVGALHPV